MAARLKPRPDTDPGRRRKSATLGFSRANRMLSRSDLQARWYAHRHRPCLKAQGLADVSAPVPLGGTGVEKGIGHGGTYHDPDGGAFGKVSLAWLDWQLKGSKAAAQMFQGGNCGLCAGPQWVTRKKKID